MYRPRGLGLNCPGDPGCPGYVEPGSADYQTSLLQAILANQVEGNPIAPSAVQESPVSSQWISGVPNVALLLAGAAVAVMLIGGRR